MSQGQLPPKQIMYPVSAVEVDTSQSGLRTLIIRIPAPNEVLIVPLSTEDAERVGKELSAPGVVLP